MVQDAVNRWWWPSLMMFGPHDSESTNSGDSMKWGIKRISNDELRQKFVDATVPQAKVLGVTLPDPDLKFDEATGHWTSARSTGANSGTWSTATVSATRSAWRIASRRWDDGAWVREAALAHAEKKRRSRLRRR